MIKKDSLRNLLCLIYILGCCIYEKPKTFGESSSEDSDDECEHCHGHKDAHKKVLPKAGDPAREGMSHPGKLFIIN